MVLAYKSLFDFELISVHGAREDLPLLFYMYNQESETVRMVRKGIKNPVVNLAVMASCYLQGTQRIQCWREQLSNKGFGTIAMDFISLKNKQTNFLEVSSFYFFD